MYGNLSEQTSSSGNLNLGSMGLPCLYFWFRFFKTLYVLDCFSEQLLFKINLGGMSQE